MHRPALTPSTATAVLAAVGLTAAALLATTASFFTVAGAQVSNDTDVNLTIQQETAVTVTPAIFDFENMQLGETNFSDIAALTLQIENTGTTNLTNIYAGPNTLSSEQDNPLGTGQPLQYAAGRFLWVLNDTSTQSWGWHHAGHITWNITEQSGGEPSGITEPTGAPVAHGFYRNASGNYLWAMRNDTTNVGCDETGASLVIKNTKDSDTDRDLTSDVSTYNVQAANANWGLAGVGQDPTEPVSGGPLNGHYVALSADCTKAYVFRWDSPSNIPDPDGAGGTQSNELVGNSSRSHITPGEVYQARLGAAVHFGVPDGSTNQTILTITASAQ